MYWSPVIITAVSCRASTSDGVEGVPTDAGGWASYGAGAETSGAAEEAVEDTSTSEIEVNKSFMEKSTLLKWGRDGQEPLSRQTH